jgi:hypothetical protein
VFAKTSQRSGAGYRGRVAGRLLRSFPFGLIPTVLSLMLCGCANFWDDVTSRDFQVQSLWEKPNPFVVLRDSNDGDKRARALRALREPAQFGGGPEDQEAVVKILTTAAVHEPPLCRLAAVESLGHFKDPRAVTALQDAYYAADAFPPDTATMIRCQALTSLGETRNPAAVELLARVARQPATKGSTLDKQQTMDERIAATRALGNFNHYQATEALVQVMKTDKNVALQDLAHASLESATGKKLPPDPKAWDQLLHDGSTPTATAAAPPQESGIRRVVGWFSFWEQ